MRPGYEAKWVEVHVDKGQLLTDLNSDRNNYMDSSFERILPKKYD